MKVQDIMSKNLASVTPAEKRAITHDTVAALYGIR